MTERPKAGFFRYIKEAFKFRWNLLLFGGATVAAILSPQPDVIVPLVMAGEMLYLGGLTTLPRFQAAIDAKFRAQSPGGIAAPPQIAPALKLSELLTSLENERRNRFLRLRARCIEMQRIATAVRGDTRDASSANQDLRVPSLDRLLWVFLRLLLAQQALSHFLSRADGAAIARSLAELKEREAKAVPGGDERFLRSIRDNLATTQLRHENFERAQSNAQFIDLELDRIENKIQALVEMAITHQDPDAISAQVDAVAEGMSQTESTIRELQAITGLQEDAEATPSILQSDLGTVLTTQVGKRT